MTDDSRTRLQIDHQPPPRWTHWISGDGDRVARLLTDLARDHAQGRVIGNIGLPNLVRDDNDELSIDREVPSLASDQVSAADPSSVRFLSVRKPPGPGDDLTALGVVLAIGLLSAPPAINDPEHSTSPDTFAGGDTEWPSRWDDHLPLNDDGHLPSDFDAAAWREDLQTRVRKGSMAEEWRQSDRSNLRSLVLGLLDVGSRDMTAGRFLRSQKLRFRMDPQGRLAAFRTSDRWWPRLVSAIGLIAGAGFFIGSLNTEPELRRTRSELRMARQQTLAVQDEVERVTNRFSAVREENRRLTQRLAVVERTLRSQTTAAPKTVATTPLKETFDDWSQWLPVISEQLDLASVLSRERVSPEEYAAANEKLAAIRSATRWWWRAVDEGMSIPTFESEIQSQTPLVQAIIRRWLRDLERPLTRQFRIQPVSGEPMVPEGYESYPIRYGIEDTTLETEADDERMAVPPRAAEASWAAGQPLVVSLQCREKFVWRTKSKQRIDGDFLICKLNRYSLGEDGFRFRIEALDPPGPPRITRRAIIADDADNAGDDGQPSDDDPGS